MMFCSGFPSINHTAARPGSKAKANFWQTVALGLMGVSVISNLTAAEEEASSGVNKEDPSKSWNVDSPPLALRTKPIDTTSGTWMNVDISPDGSTLVFDLLGDIYKMPLSDGFEEDPCPAKPEKITSGLSWDMQPQFSPDGQWIAFTSDRTGKNGKGGDNIWIIRPDGTGLRQVTAETYRLINGPEWTPDGQGIVARKHFTSRRSLGSGEMWLYHVSGVEGGVAEGIQLTQKPTDQKDVNEPVFSPDGRYLYFSEDRSPGSSFEYSQDSNGQIYVIRRLDTETGDLENYITGPGGAACPTPSPTGVEIAFVRRIDYDTSLCLFNTESGAIRVVTTDLERDMQETWAIHGVYPKMAWTPDGSAMVYWAKGKLWKIRMSDGHRVEIPFHIQDTRETAPGLRYAQDPDPDQFLTRALRNAVVSPDGNTVVFEALGKLYRKRLPDGEPNRVTLQEGDWEMDPAFSRDGRYLAYTTWRDGKLGAIRLIDLRLRNIPIEGKKITAKPGHYIDPVFTPDSQQIVYRAVSGGGLRTPLWGMDPGVYRIPVQGGFPKLITEYGSDPQFGSDSERIFLTRSSGDKNADNLQLVSMDLSGNEVRTHFTNTWGTEYTVSPDGNWVAFQERFLVYVTPLRNVGGNLNIGPNSSKWPLVKVSEECGYGLQFSGDSAEIYWTLGPDLFHQKLAPAFEKFALTSKPEKFDTQNSSPNTASNEAEISDTQKSSEKEKNEIPSIRIGFEAPTARPEGGWVIRNANLISFDEAERPFIKRDMDILIDGARIVQVGRDLEVQEGTFELDVTGQWVAPGFVDTHAHGAQATQGITPTQNWVNYARLAFGVTTVHDPSNSTMDFFRSSELARAGEILAPRLYSTGTILYGATGAFKAEIDNLDDARFHLRRMKAMGAFSVKSYNQPRRDQRQQVLKAASELEMMVVPEGGSTFMHNLTMIADGHTGIEHTLSVELVYDDVLDLWRDSGVGYTPTLSVAYGGVWGENYWYQIDDVWKNPRVASYIPPHVLLPRAKRRMKVPIREYNHIQVARITKQVIDNGGIVQAGGHGQLNGMNTHWEMWSFVQGGMSPLEALRSGTLHGAKYIGMDADLGRIEPAKLADLVIFDPERNPTVEIRDSEHIQYVIANGRLLNALTLEEVQIGDRPELAKREPFYWNTPGHGGVFGPIPNLSHCAGCASGPALQ